MRVIERNGEPGVFRVLSAQKEYTADIFELRGNGICNCKDFQTRCWKNWNDNGRKTVDYGSTAKPNPKRTICKHIKLIRLQWTEDLLLKCWSQYRQKGIEL
jgi:hypothetical protein